MSAIDADVYLRRIGAERPMTHDRASLAVLQLAHLQAVPFENLAVFAGRGVQTDDVSTYEKVVRQGRGGWCFEVNGAFARLLNDLGYPVQRLGAAVLLDGPATLVDHMVLEVMLDQPYLVEVGFGDDAPIVPLPLQESGPIETRSGIFQFFDSPQGTTLSQVVDGVPEARYRFKRVNHAPAEFEPASQRLQQDRSLHWHRAPFATRLTDDQGTRLTLTARGLKTRRGDEIERRPVAPEEWNDILLEHFGISEHFTPDQLAPS